VLTSGMRAVGGTVPTALAVVPPGPGQLVVTSNGTAVVLGFGTGLTTTNGMPMPSGGFLQLDLFAGGSGGTLYALPVTGTVEVGFMVSASSGQTGP
jgi:hypothetical protein